MNQLTIQSLNQSCSTLTELGFMQFMWGLWEEMYGEVKCCECLAHGVTNVLPFAPIHCAHILSKGSFVVYRKDVRNLIPLCIDHHTMMDAGMGRMTRKDMLIWPILEEVIVELKNEYVSKGSSSCK